MRIRFIYSEIARVPEELQRVINHSMLFFRVYSQNAENELIRLSLIYAIISEMVAEFLMYFSITIIFSDGRSRWLHIVFIPNSATRRGNF